VTSDLFRHLRANTMTKEMNRIDERQQLLVILMEECGELIQECSKNLRRGELFDKPDFKKEVGDVYAMIELLVEYIQNQSQLVLNSHCSMLRHLTRFLHKDSCLVEK